MLSALVFAAASCSADPVVLQRAIPKVSPAYFVQMTASRSASVAVTLDAQGKLANATIYKSSGDATLDAAAIDAAKRSTYAAGRTDCKPSGGTFAMDFDFQSRCPGEILVKTTAAPTFPDAVRQLKTPAVINVEVSVNAAGVATAARVLDSSGYPSLDAEATRIAMASTYWPKVVRRTAIPATPGADPCEAVPGTYQFQVTFDPNH